MSLRSLVIVNIMNGSRLSRSLNTPEGVSCKIRNISGTVAYMEAHDLSCYPNKETT